MGLTEPRRGRRPRLRWSNCYCAIARATDQTVAIDDDCLQLAESRFPSGPMALACSSPGVPPGQ